MADETITDDRTTKDRATGVATTARDEARTALRHQASDGTSRAAGAMDQLAGRLRALADGDTEQAGDLQRYARDLGDRLGGVAGRMQDRGLDGLVDDVQDFARRRPGLFLAAAAGAGFAAGRLFRGAKADAEAGSSSGNGYGYDVGTADTGLGVTGTGALSSQGAAGGLSTSLPPVGADPELERQPFAEPGLAEPSGVPESSGFEVRREPGDTGAEPAGPEGGTTPAPTPYGGATAQRPGGPQ